MLSQTCQDCRLVEKNLQGQGKTEVKLENQVGQTGSEPPRHQSGTDLSTDSSGKDQGPLVQLPSQGGECF